MDFNEWLVGFTGELSGFLYTYILLSPLVVVGVYFTIRTKAVQLRYLKDMFSQLTEKKHVQGERSIPRRSRRSWCPRPRAWARATSPAWPRP